MNHLSWFLSFQLRGVATSVSHSSPPSLGNKALRYLSSSTCSDLFSTWLMLSDLEFLLTPLQTPELEVIARSSDCYPPPLGNNYIIFTVASFLITFAINQGNETETLYLLLLKLNVISYQNKQTNTYSHNLAAGWQTNLYVSLCLFEVQLEQHFTCIYPLTVCTVSLPHLHSYNYPPTLLSHPPSFPFMTVFHGAPSSCTTHSLLPSHTSSSLFSSVCLS